MYKRAMTYKYALPGSFFARSFRACVSGIIVIAANHGSFAVSQEKPARIAWAPSHSGSCIDCSLTGSNMTGWDVSKAYYTGADLTGAHLQLARGHWANFDKVQASGVDMRLSDFSNSSFENADLTGAHLEGAQFSGAKLSNIVLVAARLAGASFIGCVMNRAQLKQVQADSADFSAASMIGVDFEGATLTDATFDNAVMNYANLTDVNVSGASFRDVRFAGARLENLKGIETAVFAGACASPATILPDTLTLPNCQSDQE